MFGVNPFHVGFDHYLVSPLSSEARVYALPDDLRERVEGIDSLMRIIGPYVSPGKILLANSLRLLPLHAVERAGVRPPPFGYCWRTLSVCSLSTAWRGLGQESSGGALQRPPPFGFASSILKDVDPASLPLDVGQFLRYLAVSHAKHIHATHMPATPVSICPIVLPASDVAIFMCDHLLGLENGIRR